jgi:hypothetical protein
VENLDISQIDVYVNDESIPMNLTNETGELDADGNLTLRIRGIDTYSLAVKIVDKDTASSRAILNSDTLLAYDGTNLGALLSGTVAYSWSTTAVTSFTNMTSLPGVTLTFDSKTLKTGQTFSYSGFTGQNDHTTGRGDPYDTAVSTYNAISKALWSYTYIVSKANFEAIGSDTKDTLSTSDVYIGSSNMTDADKEGAYQLFAALPASKTYTASKTRDNVKTSSSVTWEVEDLHSAITDYPDIIGTKGLSKATSNNIVAAICSDLDKNSTTAISSGKAMSVSVLGGNATIYAKCLYIHTDSDANKSYTIWSFMTNRGSAESQQSFAAIYKIKSKDGTKIPYYYKLGVDKYALGGTTRINGATFGITTSADDAANGAKTGKASYSEYSTLSPTASAAAFTSVIKIEEATQKFYIYEIKAPSGYARNKGFWVVELAGGTKTDASDCTVYEKSFKAMYYPENYGRDYTPFQIPTSLASDATEIQKLGGTYSDRSGSTAVILHAVDDSTTVYYTKIGVTKTELDKTMSESTIAGAKYCFTTDINDAAAGAISGGNDGAEYEVTTTNVAAYNAYNGDNDAYTEVINMGKTKTQTFYMWESEAPSGWERATGFWAINITGSTNTDGKSSKVNWAHYVKNPYHLEEQATISAYTSGQKIDVVKGYYTDPNTGVKSTFPLIRTGEEVESYYYSMGLIKRDTNGDYQDGAKFSVYGGWDFTNGKGTGTAIVSGKEINSKTTKDSSSTGSAFTELFAGVTSSSSTKTFYIYETSAATGSNKNNGVWKVEMEGVPASWGSASWNSTTSTLTTTNVHRTSPLGWGSKITSVTYYPSKTSTSDAVSLSTTALLSKEGYYASGNSTYYGDSATNRGHLVVINTHYYSKLPIVKYDYETTGTAVSGATYVLCATAAVAQDYAADGSGTSCLSQKTTSSSAVNFDVQDQGTNESVWYYVAETSAPSGWARQKGYWAIQVKGVEKTSGTGTTITKAYFYAYDSSTSTWDANGVLLGSTATANLEKGYYTTSTAYLPDKHYYYALLPIGKYDYNSTGTMVENADYVLCSSAANAQNYARYGESGTAATLSTKTTTSSTVNFDVQNIGTSDTKTFYIAEKKAASGYARNQGYWAVSVTGVRASTGSGTQITGVTYYPYAGNGSWGTGVTLSTSATTTAQKDGGYYTDATTDGLRVPDWKYYYGLGIVKRGMDNAWLSGAVYTFATNASLTENAKTITSTDSETADWVATAWTSTSSTLTLYAKETTAPTGWLKSNGLWKIVMNGTKKSNATYPGLGSTIVSITYYPTGKTSDTGYTVGTTASGWGWDATIGASDYASGYKGCYAAGTADTSTRSSGAKIIFTNTRYYYSFKIGKYTADGTRLAGSTFTIGDSIGSDNKTIGGTTSTVTPTASGDVQTRVWNSLNATKTFYMKETTTPTGYVSESGIWKITVSGGIYTDARDSEITSVTYYPSGNVTGTGYTLSSASSLDKTYNTSAKAFLGNWIKGTDTTVDTLDIINEQVIYGKISIVKYEQVVQENLSTGVTTTTDSSTDTTATSKAYGGIKFDIYTSYNSTSKTLSGHPKDASGNTVSDITLSSDGRKTLDVSALSDASHAAGDWYYGTGSKVYYIRENAASASNKGYVADTTIWKVTVTGSSVNSSEATVKWEGVDGNNNGTSATTPTNATLKAKNYTISGSGDTVVINNYNAYWQIRRTADNNYNKYFKVGNGNVRKYYYAFEVAKSNNSGTKLSGATFKAGDAITDNTTISGKTYSVSPTASANGKAGVWNKTTSTATFYMKETKNPTDYLAKNGIWVIEMQGGTKADGSDSKITSVTYYPNGNITKDSYSVASKGRTGSDYTFNTDANEHLGYYYAGTGSTTGTVYYSIVGVVEEQYYAKLGLVKTDSVSQDIVSDATYVLTTSETVAKQGGDGTKFSDGVSKITTGEDTTWFDVQNQKDKLEITYYVYEYSAPTSKLYDRNKGYWKITVQGVKNPTGAGTQITGLVYYSSSKDTTGTKLSANSSKTGIKGYLVEGTDKVNSNTDSIVTPEHPTELFGAFGILKTDTSRNNAAVKGVEYTVYSSYSDASNKKNGLITLTTNADGYAAETVKNIESGAAWYKKDGTTKTFYVRETSVANATINGKTVYLTRSKDIIEVQVTGIEGVDSVKDDYDYTGCTVKYRVVTSANDKTALTTASSKKETTMSGKTDKIKVVYFNRTNIEIPLAGTFGVKKLNADDNSAVEGLKFDVYTKSDCLSSSFVQAITTDKNGLASLDISKIADATVGAGNWYKYDSPTKTFYVRENKDSANALGYQWNDTVYKIVITGKDTLDVDGNELSTANAAIVVTDASNSKKSYTTASTGKTGYYYFTQYNSPLEVDVTKYDITGSKEIAGATLTIYKAVKNKDGSFKKNADGSYVQGDILVIDGEKITWTSTTKAHVVKKIPTGDYILVEERAPAGYFLSEDIQFSIVDSVLVATVGMKDRDLTKLRTTGSRSDLAVKAIAVLLFSSGVAEMVRRKKKKSRAAMN